MTTRSTSATAALACLLAAVLPFATGCGDRADADARSTASDNAPAPTVPTIAPVEALVEPPSTRPDGDVAAAPARDPDVIYVPTPEPVVTAMLNLAEVRAGDVLYDLGSGDGRIPITAAKRFGVRAIGIDINPVRIREANANARTEGVANLVTFREADLFTEDFRDATVVTLYLLDSLNEALRPRLLAELAPGTRIVSHAFRMGDWEPEQTLRVGDSTIHRWTVPERPAAK